MNCLGDLRGLPCWIMRVRVFRILVIRGWARGLILCWMTNAVKVSWGTTGNSEASLIYTRVYVRVRTAKQRIARTSKLFYLANSTPRTRKLGALGRAPQEFSSPSILQPLANPSPPLHLFKLTMRQREPNSHSSSCTSHIYVFVSMYTKYIHGYGATSKINHPRTSRFPIPLNSAPARSRRALNFSRVWLRACERDRRFTRDTHAVFSQSISRKQTFQ